MGSISHTVRYLTAAQLLSEMEEFLWLITACSTIVFLSLIVVKLAEFLTFPARWVEVILRGGLSVFCVLLTTALV